MANLPSGGGGSDKLAITNSTYFNSSSLLNAILFPFGYSVTGLSYDGVIIIADKVSYNGDEFCTITKEFVSSSTNLPANKYACGYQNTVTERGYTSYGKNLLPIFQLNDFTLTAGSSDFIAFSTNAIDCTCFSKYNFNTPTLDYPFKISDIVYSSDPAVDSVGTSVTFTSQSGGFYPSYTSTYLNVSYTGPYIECLSYVCAFNFGVNNSNYNYYYGLVSNNKVLIWFKLRQNSTIHFPSLVIDLSTVLPDMYP